MSWLAAAVRLVDWPHNDPQVVDELEAPMIRATNPTARDVELPATQAPALYGCYRICKACDVGGAALTCWICGAPLK